jgi:hypothetical protein
MKLSLAALSALLCLAAPAFADTCSAATEAATRAALDRAADAGRRTAVVRVKCDGASQTFVLHRVGETSVTVRELKRAEGNTGVSVRSKKDFSSSSQSRVIRVGD